MPFNAYAWRLEVAVWTKQAQPNDTARCKPRLVLVHQKPGRDFVHECDMLGFIEKSTAPAKGLHAPWLIVEYLSNPDGGDNQDDTGYGFRTNIGEGETRSPRPSAEEALRHLLSIAAGTIPAPEHAALTATGPGLLTALKATTEAYGRRQAQTGPT